MNLIALAVGLIPGAGHAWLGFNRRGLLLFFFFANALNVFFASRYLWEYGGAEMIQGVSATISIFLWLYTYSDLVRISSAQTPSPKTKTDKKAKEN